MNNEHGKFLKVVMHTLVEGWHVATNAQNLENIFLWHFNLSFSRNEPSFMKKGHQLFWLEVISTLSQNRLNEPNNNTILVL